MPCIQPDVGRDSHSLSPLSEGDKSGLGIKKDGSGLPTVKQFYIQLKKDEEISSFFTLPCLQGVVCYTVLSVPGGKRMMFLLTQK